MGSQSMYSNPVKRVSFGECVCETTVCFIFSFQNNLKKHLRRDDSDNDAAGPSELASQNGQPPRKMPRIS